ncbi:MAG: MFS transporter [Coriobacteriia bacterium]|nr:MFS transporter [Coriobacteriia bacterium]
MSALYADGKEYTVSEAIDSFGINGHTWLMFVLLGLANIFDGYDFMIVNSTNTYLAASFGLISWVDGKAVTDSAAIGSLTTWGLLGMVLGGAVGGIMSDKIGRKKMLIIACLFYGVFTLPQAFSQNIPFFAAFRLIAGFGVGSCIPVVTTCFSEIIPSKHRGVFVTFGMAFMVAGWVVAGLVSNPICTAPDSILGDFTGASITIASGKEFVENWRLCYLIGALPVIYGILLIFLMHETPHWYANNGQKDKAAAELHRLATQTGAGDMEFDPNMMIVPPKPAKSSVNVLFSKKYIVATAAIWTTYFVGQFCVYGMNAWIPTWFQGVGYSAADSVNLQTMNNFAAILSNVTVGFVSDRIGRKKNLCLSWILCIVAIVLCSIFVQANAMVLCMVLMLLFGFALNYAITAVQPLMPESYPTAMRNTGTAWCQAFARFGGSASSIVLGAIASMAFFQGETGTNWSMVVLVLCIPFALAFVCSILFVHETGGKTMDQLAAESTLEDASDTGMVPFIVMMCIAAFLAVLCIVCPLVVQGWSKRPVALPLMATGLLLPFVFFFIFAGPAAAKQNFGGNK